jgi:RNA polymerase sigma factor (sigma-70 family)
MSTVGSVTRWIEELRAGESAAAQPLWETYYSQMVALARRKLAGTPRRVADEEDVALSAFNSFCVGIKRGQFTRLTDRTNLWPLLVAITAHKSVDQLRRQGRQKRLPVSSAQSPESNSDADGILGLISREPSPEFALEVAEQLEQLLASLDVAGDADLREIAILRMEGYSQKEIAERLKCVQRTVARKLQLVQQIWTKGLEP